MRQVYNEPIITTRFAHEKKETERQRQIVQMKKKAAKKKQQQESEAEKVCGGAKILWKNSVIK